MKIGVAGSVGLDHLMTFPGKFTDSLVAGSLEKVSLSFLVDGLDVRRGDALQILPLDLEFLASTPF
jgi:adenosine kinase